MKEGRMQEKSAAAEKVHQALLEDLLACQPVARFGRYFNGIVHNLNGCLQNAHMRLELLQMSLESPTGPESPEQISRGLRQLAEELDTLSGMLQFWGQQVDYDELRSETWLDVNQLLQNELSFLGADLFFKHQVCTELELAENLPPVHGSALALGQVFAALLENAVDAMRHCEQRRLFISTTKQEAAILVRIRDTGCGVPEGSDLLDPVFTSKGDEDGTRRGFRRHTGLGLCLAQRNLEPYGGTITWQSNPGETVLTVHLPVRPGASAPAKMHP
jgi:two-component system C4-dicarboxylate transport sensor histidine kinase DctB